MELPVGQAEELLAGPSGLGHGEEVTGGWGWDLGQVPPPFHPPPSSTKASLGSTQVGPAIPRDLVQVVPRNRGPSRTGPVAASSLPSQSVPRGLLAQPGFKDKCHGL